ncbi:hypothetical protein [Actinoplanes sp. G11-F43]|uniref:hypothetical protein n=1 Tax=Actinoplanes sp. G11-F43 TaxID=3424130 RepID=UPI003D33148B
MDNSTSFWLGLGLAIPIGIGVNLMTPYLQNAVGRHSAVLRRRMAVRVERDRALAELVSQDPQAMTLRGMMSIMDALQYAFTATALFTATLVFIWLADVADMAFTVAAIVAALVGLIQLVRMLNHIRRVRRIGNQVNVRNGWPVWDGDPRDLPKLED